MGTQFRTILQKIIGKASACGLCGDINQELRSQISIPFKVTVTVAGVRDVQNFVRSQDEIKSAMSASLRKAQAKPAVYGGTSRDL